MASGVPRPLIRRPIAIGVLLITTALLPVFVVLGGFLGGVIDMLAFLRGNRSFRRVRGVLLISGLVLVDFIAFLIVVGIFAASVFSDEETHQNRLLWIMTRWATALLRVISGVVPLPIDRGRVSEALAGGNAVVVARHRSHLDAIIPAWLIGIDGLTPRYTLKHELQWEPNIDLVGHGMPHRFVTRAPRQLEAELAPIRELGEGIDSEAVAVIFPEGTFFTEQRKSQIVKSLEVRDPGRADPARSMNHLLPPRPGGTLALLEGAPTADVVILGHIGFEPFGSIREILANLGSDHAVRLEAWRFPRDEIPADAEAKIDWLFERWLELDHWITDQHRTRSRDEAS